MLGEALPPYVIYKAIHLLYRRMIAVEIETRYHCPKSVWFEVTIFEDWIEFLLLPRLEKALGTKVVIGDEISSNLSIHILDICNKRQIKFTCLSLNTIYITQP